jgi:purine-binding chemotaxis protein CheW
MSELVASQKVMRNYLNALLTEEQEPEVSVVAEVKKQQLNQLLATVQPEKPAVVTKVAAPAPVKTEPVRAKVIPETIVASCSTSEHSSGDYDATAKGPSGDCGQRISLRSLSGAVFLSGWIKSSVAVKRTRWHS